jgi:8-oxo-dGTP pyrophosphatase MutT (NUDIX family)
MEQTADCREKKPVLNVALCFCECEKKILFLQRSNDCKEPGTWTAPGGKVEKDETPIEGIIREFQEETGILLSKEFVQNRGFFSAGSLGRPLVIHLFQTKVSTELSIILSHEHQAYRWCFLEEVWNLPLISGAERCLKVIYPSKILPEEEV